MNWKQISTGTLAYTCVTFPLAVVWHIVLFEDLYRAFGYIEGEPSFVLGFLTILIQGFILSSLYPYVKFRGTAFLRGLKYSLVLGIFFWTSHVLAFVAKQVLNNSLSFILMESFYLLLQFGAYGLCIGWIYRGLLEASENP